MSLRNVAIRAYTRSEVDASIFPEDARVSYAHPKYYAKPVVTTDYVYVQEDRDRHILEDYAERGVPEWKPADETVEAVEIVSDVSKPEPQVDPEDAPADAEDATESSSVETDPTKMKWFDLRAYVKESTGTSPKNKAEAFDLLGIGE